MQNDPPQPKDIEQFANILRSLELREEVITKILKNGFTDMDDFNRIE